MLGSLAWMLGNIRIVQSQVDEGVGEPILVTAEVELQRIVERTVFRGKIGPSTTMTIEYHGQNEDGNAPILTWAPPVGTSVREGGVIVEISGRPVILIEGDTPS